MNLFYKKTTLLLFLAGTAIMLPVMFFTGRPLNTPGTPRGILCLEFANTGKKVENIIGAWKSRSINPTGLIAAAKKNTYFDFIFLFFYSLLLFTSCRQLGASLPGKKIFSAVFNAASLFALTAGLLDIFENLAMLKSLDGPVSNQLAMATAGFAAIKWILVILVILFLAGGLLYRRSIKTGKI
jgi:hypothetical protein